MKVVNDDYFDRQSTSVSRLNNYLRNQNKGGLGFTVDHLLEFHDTCLLRPFVGVF